MTVPDEWVELARKTADDFARSLCIPDLTQEEADAFAKLGVPGMQEMVGRPVGVTLVEYRKFRREGDNYIGPNLDFMLSLLRGDHLKGDGFLAGAK